MTYLLARYNSHWDINSSDLTAIKYTYGILLALIPKIKKKD